jgi:glutathione S-transferase
MTAQADTLILHHYAASPFSEKMRVVFGIKNLVWRACDQPVVLPKAELQLLTGGYRRIPVLQIGADLYFDTSLIVDELERRFPAPAAYAGVGAGMGPVVTAWTDAWAGQQGMFWQAVMSLFAGDIDLVDDPVFVADRGAMLGGPLDAAALTAALPEVERNLRACFDRLERQLGDGRDFLFGAAPSVADAGAFHPINFLRLGRGRSVKLLEAFPRVLAWEARVRGIGHGRRGADVAREEAIAIARAAKPAVIAETSVQPDLRPGDAIRLSYHDANTPPLDATLVAAGYQSLSVRPAHSELGDLLIHMPYTTARIEKR